jgi:twitching motility two-component system response regulator PilH
LARKILLADDSVTAQNMGRKILADAGYEVITVNNGSAALKKIAEAKPDLIVLDVYMPGYSGLEVCQRLKENQETARTPVLLTVGKLEPFKPEEAKRVRAEAFIVKPFEASELLSAISKLEDKMVPRTESSKPGRFARATAGAEESGRAGRNAVSEEDSGWRNRIVFPPMKKKTTEAEDGDDPAIYNAINRDLRTVVEQGPGRKERGAAASSEERKDVAPREIPEGLRDVSVEEIAAITAAAAQVQAVSARPQESSEPKQYDAGERAPEGQIGAGFEAVALQQPESETREEIRAGARAEAVHAESVAAAVSADVPATAQPDTEVIGAIAALVPGNENASNADSPGFAAGLAAEEVPVTMAVGSTAGERAEARWMAIPVAVSPDEAAIPLELEMQKAYAAFAAAEANSPGFVSSIPEPAAPAREVVALLPAPTPHADASAPSAIAEQELGVFIPEPAPASPSLHVAPSTSTEEIGRAVTSIAAGASRPDTSDQVESESGQMAPPSYPYTAPDSEVTAIPEMPAQGSATPQSQAQEPGHGADQTLPLEDAANEPVTQKQLEAEPIVAEPAAAQHGVSAMAGKGAKAEKTESDLAETTAAAWASWRQIRETAQPQATAQVRNPSEREFEAEKPSTPETAAMAAAAGAEKAPEFSDSSDPTAIASIVDRVLADLRPRIVEEISRKLGDKKK